MKSTILLGIIAVTIFGSFAVSGILVQAGMEPIERTEELGDFVFTSINNVPVQSTAQCPTTHPFLIGGTYDIDASSVDFNFFKVTTNFDISSNSFIVTGEQFSTEINVGVRAHALCANVNFPTQMGMIGGELLDINSISLLVSAVGTNPVITGLVGITIAGVAGQAVWFVHRRRKKVE